MRRNRKKTYVVVVSDAWVRDGKFFDMGGLSDEEVVAVYKGSKDYADRWYDHVVDAYMGCVVAESKETAKALIAKLYYCDPRQLRAYDVLEESNHIQEMLRNRKICPQRVQNANNK